MKKPEKPSSKQNQKSAEVLSAGNIVRPQCPDCINCACGGYSLKDLDGYQTAWYGYLHYYKCKCCGECLVSQNSGELEIAA